VSEVETWALEVTDLKQYAYCPRLVYYRYCLPTLRPVTYKMEAGTRAHERERAAAARRSLRRFDLQQAERFFDVPLFSPDLHLSGRVDLVLVTQEGNLRQAIPVDFKNARRVQPNWKDQLAAYALLLEACWQLPVKRGFIYLIPNRKAEEVKLGTRAKQRARQLVNEIVHFVQREQTPPPTSRRGRCVDCEYLHFCNDVF
jgi:CRISPR-associated exonuclease Cas4